MDIVSMEIADIKTPYKALRNKQSLEQFAVLSQCLTRFQLVYPLVVNKQTGNLIDGYKRLQWHKDRGETVTQVKLVDLPKVEEIILMLALNRHGESCWNYNVLEKAFIKLQKHDVNIFLTGFWKEEVDVITDEVELDKFFDKIESVAKQGGLF